jgi:hypothetical protein
MFNVSIVLYTFWNDIRVNKVDSLGVPTFNVSIFVLHALKRYQGNKVDSLGVPMFNVPIVFYTL